MAMTAAERAKKYRDNKKKDPGTHQEYLLKEKERYKKRKAKGEFDYSKKSEREMNLQRRKWRVKKRRQREKKKNVTAGINFMHENTPENSPVRINHNVDEEVPAADIQRQEESPFEKNIEKSRDKLNDRPHQALSGQKRVKRKKAKAYRTIDFLKKENSRYKALWETTRKRIQRMKKVNNKGTKLGAPKKKKTVKPQQVKIVTKIVRKIYKRTGHSVIWNVEMRRKIRQFLEEDINSTQAPGKKDTITRGKLKMQKRYLNDTLLNLYKSFVEKYPDDKVSYPSFCRLRPFWIVQQKVDSRETCLCKVHENLKYRIQKLYRLKIINEPSPDKAAESLVCEVGRKECAYRECRTCETKDLPNSLTDENAGEQVTYYQWVNRTEEISTKTGTKTVTKTVKIVEQSTIETLFKDTVVLMRDKYLKHSFNIRHQYVTMKSFKDNITESDAVIHVDFSENFNCKLSEEVQSMHFGGSRKQISLHTVVLYTKDKTVSFCTVSENTNHGPGAIWAHLKPVLDYVKRQTEVRRVHFVSDGPCTQYRSKVNFYLFHQEILGKFDLATWNFTESGHGKSAADGVGGTVKRTADRLVANGIDIPDAESFCKHTAEHLHKVKVILIEDNEIERSSKLVPNDLQTVKGTMKLHQVIIGKENMGTLHLKSLSCFCKWPERCSCYILGETPEHQLPVDQSRVPLIGDADSEPTAEKVTSVPIPEGTDSGQDTHGRCRGVRPHPELVGTWCVVKYESQAYPGIIQDLDDESAEVKCMCRIGVNRFFWPLLEDIIW